MDAFPDLYGRLSPTTLRRGRGGQGKVALTFDDGPDPEVTAKMLDALASLDVKATFFVVGVRARQHAALLKRMVAEGHEVALHGGYHRHAWGWAPWAAGRALIRADRDLAAVLGEEALHQAPYFRPPWGSANLGLLLAASKLGRRIVLWSVTAEDWRKDSTPERILQRVLDHVRDGDIVDLHDAGGAPGAPLRTLEAMPRLVGALRNQDLSPCRISDLLAAGEEPVTWTVRLWEVWEGLFAWGSHLRAIGREGLIAIGVRPYRGPNLRSSLGEDIHSGDLAGEIHLGSYALSRLAGDVRESFRARRMLNEALDELAHKVSAGDFPGVKLFFGTTLLGRAARHLGLHSEPLARTPGVRLNALYMKLLATIYRPEGRQGKRRTPQPPTLCWVSREELLARHRRLAAVAAEKVREDEAEQG